VVVPMCAIMTMLVRMIVMMMVVGMGHGAFVAGQRI